ncbi:MAG: PAS domain S-box protein [Candidatus Thiodiazotropha sp.]
MTVSVLVVSLLLQIVAVYFALRLIRITGRSLAWGLIAAGIALMAVRRGISLGQILQSEGAVQVDLAVEMVALTISFLMAFGIERITPVITSLQADSRRLSESETLYRLLFENSPLPIWEEDFSGIKKLFNQLRRKGVRDLDDYLNQHPQLIHHCVRKARIVRVNQAALRLHRADSKEALLAGLADTFTPESYAIFREELIDLWLGRAKIPRDAQVKTLEGELRDVTIEFVVCPGYEESLARVYVSLVDITERKRAEQALQLQEQEFRSLVEHSPDLIVRYDTQLRRVYVNPAWEKTSGLSYDEVVNVSADEIPRVPRAVSPEYLSALQRALISGSRQAIEFSWTNAFGNELYLQFVVLPEFDADGEVVSLLSVGRDISALREAERERQIHIDFLANMDRINRAIQGADHLDTMMRSTLDEVLEIYACDRASLVYPLDPDSPTWSVPMERYKSQWPGISSIGSEIPMSPEVAAMHRWSLQHEHPLVFGVGTDFPLPLDLQAHGDKSGIAMAIYPKSGKPWGFAIIQCSHERVWNEEEIHLFEEIGWRLADGLGSLLTLRDLRDSEARYRRIFDTAREGIWGQDEAFVTSFVNAHMAEMLGCAREEMLGRQVVDFLFEEDLADHEQKIINRRMHLSEAYERE